MATTTSYVQRDLSHPREFFVRNLTPETVAATYQVGRRKRSLMP